MSKIFIILSASSVLCSHALASAQPFHLKESVSVAYMTEEQGFQLAEGQLFKKASEICGKTIGVRVSAFAASKPGANTVALEADFQCGI